MNVLVVGAGIMGLSVARGLVGRVDSIRVVDRDRWPGGGSSQDDHRLIRLPYGKLSGYRRLVQEAYPAWDRLWSDLGTCHYVHTGTLIIGDPKSEWVKASHDDLLSADIDHLDATGVGAGLFGPGLSMNAGERALWVPRGGVLLAAAILDDMRRRLLGQGVELREETACIRVEPGGTATWPGGDVETFDHIVLATGGYDAIMQGMRPPHPTRQPALYLRPDSPGWDRAPMILDLSPEGGYYFVPPVEGRPAKIGSHSFGPSSTIGVGSVSLDEETALLNLLSARARFAKSWSVEGTRLCHYDVAPSERFVFERTGAITRISGFSGHGFKFGPLIGERVADCVVQQRSAHSIRTWLAAR